MNITLLGVIIRVKRQGIRRDKSGTKIEGAQFFKNASAKKGRLIPGWPGDKELDIRSIRGRYPC